MARINGRTRRLAGFAGASLMVLGFALAPHARAMGDPLDLEPNDSGHIPTGPTALGDCFGPYYLNSANLIIVQPGPDLTFGTGGDDVIIGTDEADQIYGLGGSDRICSGGGNDRVEGGLLQGGSGIDDDDQIDGGSGADVLHGGNGADVIYAGVNPPNDDLSPFYHDFLYGEEGDDYLAGQGGPDVFDCGTGFDYADGGTGMLDGSPEDDWVVAPDYCNVQVNIP